MFRGGGQELRNLNFSIQKKLFTLSATDENTYFFDTGKEPGEEPPPLPPPVATPLFHNNQLRS